MVRGFYSQKTEQILQKFELIHWRQLVQKKFEQKHQDLSDNWKNCVIGERIRLDGRNPNSIRIYLLMQSNLDVTFQLQCKNKTTKMG